MKIVLKPMTYPVENNEDLRITITIGNAQLGAASFTNFNGEFIAGHNDLHTTVAIENKLIGSANQARGRTRTISVSSSDVNPKNNRIPVTILINDQELQTIVEEADKDNDTVKFIIPITFK
jgi:hypothetical protein